MATTAKKATKTAPKKTTKKTSAKAGASKTTATKTTKTSATKTSATKTKPAEQGFHFNIGEVEITPAAVREFVSDSAYATVGASDRVLEAARDLPEHLETLRKERAESFLKETRERVEQIVKDAPTRLRQELEDSYESARKEFKSSATRGRKVWDELQDNETAKQVLDRTEGARTQVNQAVNNLRKVVEQGQDAVQDAAERVGLRRSA